MLKILRIVSLLLFLSSCSDIKPFLKETGAEDYVQLGNPQERPNHENVLTFYALGDWGTGKENQKAVAQALKENVNGIPSGRKIAPFVLGLGDNIYEHGLPEGWGNPEAVKLLEKTFGSIYNDIKYDDENLTFHIVPGNHDYDQIAGGRKGFGDIIHQETTAEKLYPYWKYYPIDPARNSDTEDSTNYQALKDQDIFSLTVPENIPIETDGKISITAIDTQVLLDLYQKNDQENLQKHFRKLESLLMEDAKWKFIIGHHPVQSHGKHGGFRTAFWWMPPIFLGTFVDILFVKPLQELDNASNRRFQHDLMNIMKKYRVHFYLAGHDHNLQFLKVGQKNFQIISGSAAKLSPVTHRKDTLFSQSAHGFVRFDLADNALWIEFFEVDVKNRTFNSTALYKISS